MKKSILTLLLFASLSMQAHRGKNPIYFPDDIAYFLCQTCHQFNESSSKYYLDAKENQHNCSLKKTERSEGPVEKYQAICRLKECGFKGKKNKDKFSAIQSIKRHRERRHKLTTNNSVINRSLKISLQKKIAKKTKKKKRK